MKIYNTNDSYGPFEAEDNLARAVEYDAIMLADLFEELKK